MKVVIKPKKLTAALLGWSALRLNCAAHGAGALEISASTQWGQSIQLCSSSTFQMLLDQMDQIWTVK